MKYRKEFFDFTTQSRHSLTTAELIKPLIDEKSRFLDVGCGDGAVGSIVENYTGLEVNAGNYETSKNSNVKHFNNGENLNDWLSKNLEYNDQVFLCDVLEHIASIERVMKIVEKCKPKLLCFVVPNEVNLRNRIRFLFGTLPTAHGYKLFQKPEGYRHVWLSCPIEFDRFVNDSLIELGYEKTEDFWLVGYQKSKGFRIRRWLWHMLAVICPAKLVASERVFVLELKH